MKLMLLLSLLPWVAFPTCVKEILLEPQSDMSTPYRAQLLIEHPALDCPLIRQFSWDIRAEHIIVKVYITRPMEFGTGSTWTVTVDFDGSLVFGFHVSPSDRPEDIISRLNELSKRKFSGRVERQGQDENGNYSFSVRGIRELGNTKRGRVKYLTAVGSVLASW